MKILKKSFLITIVMIILCGFIYPLLVTGVSKVIFPYKSSGSIVNFDGREVGSELIGQDFTDNRFFKGRISSINYNTFNSDDFKNGKVENPLSSGSANYAPSNSELQDRVKKDIDKFLTDNPDVKKEDIPTDILTSSGSGLDPHISLKAAEIQVKRVAKATTISEDELNKIIDKNLEKKQLGIFGEDRVNVLKLNLEVAKMLMQKGKL